MDEHLDDALLRYDHLRSEAAELNRVIEGSGLRAHATLTHQLQPEALEKIACALRELSATLSGLSTAAEAVAVCLDDGVPPGSA